MDFESVVITSPFFFVILINVIIHMIFVIFLTFLAYILYKV